jgi:hypothetical protein
MSSMATQALSGTELEKLRGFPEFSREEPVRYFTLSPTDEGFLVGHRRQGNCLGSAVQLCTPPWNPGWVSDWALCPGREMTLATCGRQV